MSYSMRDSQTESMSLKGLRVLVTRPAHQAESLCQRLKEYGAEAIRFPLLEIEDPVDPAALERMADHLQDFDWAIFVSANAVQRALSALLASRAWPVTVRIAVVGKSSAAALQSFGLTAEACPEQQFDSEGLLALPQMQQVAGLRMVIFRGNGGRGILANTLRSRGADVNYVECYQRVKPAVDSHKPDQLGKITGADVVLINSADSLKNLCELLDNQQVANVSGMQLLVVSQRLVEIARKSGFVKPPLVADNATDQAVIDALLAWQDERRKIT